MDFQKILVYVVTGCLLVADQVSAYFNQTFGDITFVLSDVNADNSSSQTSLTVAQIWCQSKGYTLAKIPDKEVQNYAQQFISSALNSGMMTKMDLIMLNGKLNSNLPGTWMWVNGQQIKNGINIQDQPPDLSQGYFYGYLKTSDFKLHASTHNNGRPYICEKPGNDCVGGQSLNDRCYQRKTNSLTWYSARNDCVEGGGDLASFETLNDTTFRSALGSTLLANASATEYWVGIQRVEWRWEDTGLPIKYTKWESGSPSNTNDCLCLRLTTTSDWLWYGCGCSQTYRFICMEFQTTRRPTIPTSSTTAIKGASSTKSTSGSVAPTPTSPSFSVQPASNSSVPDIQTTRLSDSRLAVGLGIGLGVGVILVVAIVLAVIFMRRRQKRKRNDARREVNATPPQTSAFSSASETSGKPNQNSPQINGIQLGRTTADKTQTYETLQSADGRSPESPYQQLDLYETPN